MKQKEIITTVDDDILLPAVYDCIFKSIMLDPNLKGVLIDIINYITEIPKYILNDMEVRNIKYIVENKKDKKMRSDIIVNVGKMYLNIEMNRTKYKGLFRKNEAYLSKLKSSMYNESEDYLDSGEVIQINFDNFYYYNHKQDIYKFVTREEKTGEIDKDSTIKYHVCLQNISKRCYNKNIKELNRFERFCLILRTKSKEYAKKVAGDDKEMEKLVEKLEYLSKDEKVIGLYNAEVEDEKIKRTIKKAAKQEGREQEKRAIALNLYKNSNMDIKNISAVVGLDEKEIELLIMENRED